MRTFSVIWFGQIISLIGTSITGFGLGVWVFWETGSVTQFALISVATTVPSIIFSPLAGVLVDRWDRRWAMILSDTGAALSTLTIWLLIITGHMQIWHIYVTMAFSSICNAVQVPAYGAAITLLVTEKHYGRANGMVQMAEAVAYIAGPVIAGVLIGLINLQGIILIDLGSFLVAVFTLFLVRIPPAKQTPVGQVGKGSLRQETIYGWNYIRSRPGLLSLLVYFAANNMASELVTVLLTPLVLSFTDATTLGIVLSVGGIGLLLGGLIMSIWGGPYRRINSILGFSFLRGIVLIIGGLQPNVWLIALAAFFYSFNLAFILGSSQAIWQSKVESDVQGRVFAARRMVALSTIPFAYLLAGPLTDYIFEPLMASEGLLAASVGRIIGVGPGRGIGLVFILAGLFTLLSTFVAYSYPHLRLIEDELPNVN